MTEIVPRVFLGSNQDAQDITTLKSLGITNVVVAGSELSPTHTGILFHQKYPLEDHPGFNISEHLSEIIDYMHDSLDRGGSVLIHGSNGNSRGAFIAMAWMMQKELMNYNQAWFHLQSKWPSASPNSGFLIQLRKIEENLRNSIPRFGSTSTFPNSQRGGLDLDEQADQYENTLRAGQGFSNVEENAPSKKANNPSVQLKGPHTDFWDPHHKTYKDDKHTLRYLPDHHNQFIGQIPVDETVSNKYFTKNAGCISPLKPKYEKHKSSYQAKQELNERYSRKGIALAKDSLKPLECDEDRGLHVYPISKNIVGRGMITRDHVNNGLIKKRGDHLRLTSFKNGNFGF
jgi:atypical dual specificity phosphatase